MKKINSMTLGELFSAEQTSAQIDLLISKLYKVNQSIKNLSEVSGQLKSTFTDAKNSINSTFETAKSNLSSVLVEDPELKQLYREKDEAYAKMIAHIVLEGASRIKMLKKYGTAISVTGFLIDNLDALKNDYKDIQKADFYTKDYFQLKEPKNVRQSPIPDFSNSTGPNLSNPNFLEIDPKVKKRIYEKTYPETESEAKYDFNPPRRVYEKNPYKFDALSYLHDYGISLLPYGKDVVFAKTLSEDWQKINEINKKIEGFGNVEIGPIEQNIEENQKYYKEHPEQWPKKKKGEASGQNGRGDTDLNLKPFSLQVDKSKELFSVTNDVFNIQTNLQKPALNLLNIQKSKTSSAKDELNFVKQVEKISSQNKKQSKGPDPYDVFKMAFGEAQKLGGALNNLMSALHIGTQTFVGEVITGFNSALNVISAIMQVIQAAQSVGGFFSFLGGLLKIGGAIAATIATGGAALPAIAGAAAAGGFARGGTVPGIGSGDTVSAMLTPGEYVIKKSVVNKFGSGFFEWINGGGLTSSLAGHYASGGMVAAGLSKQSMNVNFGDIKFKVRGQELVGVINNYNYTRERGRG